MTISVNNFSRITWEYLTNNLHDHGIFWSRSTTVIESAFLESDNEVVQKFHGKVLSFELSLPNHIHVAKLLLAVLLA